MNLVLNLTLTLESPPHVATGADGRCEILVADEDHTVEVSHPLLGCWELSTQEISRSQEPHNNLW